jgi:hypothetical protein
MVPVRWLTVMALVLAAGLASTSTANASPLKDLSCDGDCAQPSYSPFRYWAARAARLGDNVRGPRLTVEAPDRHPEIPATFTILKFPCPAVDPAATIIEPPTPPATSRFRY